MEQAEYITTPSFSAPRSRKKTVAALKKQISRRDKINATARERLGKRIKSVETLALMAQRKRSVYCANCFGLLPAAVVMNMQATTVLNVIRTRGIYEYKPKKGGAK